MTSLLLCLLGTLCAIGIGTFFKIGPTDCEVYVMHGDTREFSLR